MKKYQRCGVCFPFGRISGNFGYNVNEHSFSFQATGNFWRESELLKIKGSRGNSRSIYHFVTFTPEFRVELSLHSMMEGSFDKHEIYKAAPTFFPAERNAKSTIPLTTGTNNFHHPCGISATNRKQYELFYSSDEELKSSDKLKPRHPKVTAERRFFVTPLEGEPKRRFL